ncbi:MAG: two-component system sensor histidine kinase NtrB [Myxococcaceae bacterium]
MEPLLLDDLRLKLTWLSVFRTVATSLLLAATALRLLPHPAQELSREDSLSFVIIGVVYALTLTYALLIRAGRVALGYAYVQVLGDVVLASALVYVTGGAESPFTFAFSLAIVAGAVVLGQRGAIVAALASGAAFTGLVFAMQTGWLRSAVGRLPEGRVVFVLVSTLLAQSLIAVLAAFLSRQLAAAGGALQAREADLRRLASIHEQIVAAIPSGIVTCDAERKITFVNQAARTMLGLALEGAVWGQVEDILPGIGAFFPGARRQELSVQTTAGLRSLGLAVAQLPESAGLLVVFQDLTELRHAEQELKRMDQLAALGALSAELAHEIRNPLAAMRGAAQMMGQEASDPNSPSRSSSTGRLAAILVRESDRLAGLVDNFLRFARPPEPKLGACDLKGVVEDIVQMLGSDPLADGIRIGTVLEPVMAMADGDQIRQVLLNLLRNALLAAARGGAVRIGVEHAAGMARLRVWDSGGSIPAADIERIFEPFFTTRHGGTGLGLSAAHSIVRAHKGTIRVSSSVSDGTEFVVELPLAAEARLERAGGR